MDSARSARSGCFSECPGGIDSNELNECLQEIGNDDCNNPLDTLGRIVACRSSDLCRATP
ncbi:DUF6184 family natural product biosynthesis lipoprotein [Sorangium sp. So ce233]|uniref:DUF6184 family natural product biosynthesis lipoprotein n=1 Tax=Sorangium sp. So ce233 TaxID=3133290 RepID=UPI003F608184